MRIKKSDGFSLVEMLVVIALISMMASLTFATIRTARLHARDAARVAGLGAIVNALELYKDNNGTYPPVTTSGSEQLAGWEVSFYPNFLETLLPYVRVSMKDPLNIGPPVVTDGVTMMFNTRPDGSFFYMYYNYGPGTCNIGTGFAIVGFRAAEGKAIDKSKFPKATCGPNPCTGGPYPGIDLPRCRDWSSEFDYSVMLIP